MKFSWGTFECWKGYVRYQIVAAFIPIVLAHLTEKLSMSASSLDANILFPHLQKELGRTLTEHGHTLEWGCWHQSRIFSQLSSVSRHHPSLTWSLWALCCSLPLSSEGYTCRGQKFGSASYLSAFILQVLSTSLGPEPSQLDFSQLVEHTWSHNLLSR